jgi:DNA-binding response OmpR family regulator
VLLVEDDRAVCALLDAGLGARGAEVIAVHDRAALRAALPGIGSIDAVLLDLSPIQGDVQGSIDELRRACPAAGIVFISGSAVALEAELTAGDPRARWVRKPFEVSEITQAIAELLPRR